MELATQESRSNLSRHSMIVAEKAPSRLQDIAGLCSSYDFQFTDWHDARMIHVAEMFAIFFELSRNSLKVQVGHTLSAGAITHFAGSWYYTYSLWLLFVLFSYCCLFLTRTQFLLINSSCLIMFKNFTTNMATLQIRCPPQIQLRQPHCPLGS